MNRKNFDPVTWVPTVYFAMGLPFVVLNMVSVLMFKGLGISDAQIALWTSVIMMPWTLKFLWSPFLEMYKTKKFFVVLTQILSLPRPTSLSTRSRISPAALLVKVIARIFQGATPCSIRYATRCVSTRVLPEPAPAKIRSGPSV